MNLLKENKVFNYFDWAKKFNRPFILDGAMGSIVQSKYPELYVKGVWMDRALIEHPDFIQNLHLDYIKAGSDIITTFTFRTNPYSVNLHGHSVGYTSEKLVKLAVDLCLEARKQATDLLKPVFIAGSNSPMEHCYFGDVDSIKDEEIYENHYNHMKSLMNAGVDFILNETFGILREILIVCEICNKNEFPFVISLYCDENLKLLSGENIIDAIELLKKYCPLAISFNCVKYSVMKKIVKEIDLKELVWGCYINCGDEKMQENFVKLNGKVEGSGVLDFSVSPQELKTFSEDIIKLHKARPAFLGSCCCSNPEHTKKIAEIFEK